MANGLDYHVGQALKSGFFLGFGAGIFRAILPSAGPCRANSNVGWFSAARAETGTNQDGC